MKMLVFFLAKCVGNATKTMVVDRKNQKALVLLYLASKPLRKAANSSGVRTEPTRQIWAFRTWTLSPNFFRLNWTFPLPPKRHVQLSILLNFFSINKFVYDFCCLCLFCYNAGQHAISRQKHMWCGRTDGRACGADGRTYVRTYGRTVTWLITSLPKFIGLIDYQISLAMELRWRASALAPLLLCNIIISSPSSLLKVISKSAVYNPSLLPYEIMPWVAWTLSRWSRVIMG